MTIALPGRAPANDQELIRSFHDRIRALEHARTLRVGPWVLATDALTGNLVASRPGQTVLIDGEGATEVEPQSINLSKLSNYVTTSQLDDALAGIGGGGLPDLGEIAESLWSSLYEQLTGLLNPTNALAALANFFKLELGAPITSDRLPLIPLSHIRNVNPNLLVDGSFDDERTLLGFPDWDYDEADGKSRPGCAYTIADGSTHVLRSNVIEVGTDDKIDFEVWTKWIDLTMSGSLPIKLSVASYQKAAVPGGQPTLIGGGPVVLAQGGATGSSAGWVKLSATNWAPPAGADFILLELTVAATATSGAVKFDDGIVRKTGSLPQGYVDGLVSALAQINARIQEILNKAWDAVFGDDEGIIDRTADELALALKNIPGANVVGVGAATMVDTITDILDNVWRGFTRQGGSGKSIADVANAATNAADTADTGLEVGEWNNAVIGIRDNTPLGMGTDPTAVSMFDRPQASPSTGDLPFISVTSAAVPLAFWVSPNDAKRGSIQWVGRGLTNVTALYLDFYAVNKETQTVTLLHSSPDQVPKLTANWQNLRYDMATPLRVDTAHGDLLAVGFRVTGTGSHQVAARLDNATWPADAAAIPRRPSAQRVGVGNTTLGALTWSGDTPWIALGIVEGDVAPPYFAPRTQQIGAAGAWAYEIPTWANFVDVIKLGDGGGGAGGNGGVGIAGEGGDAGQWHAETLQRGVHFPSAGATLTGLIGAGGNAGARESNGGNGSGTTRAAIAGGAAATLAAGGGGGTGEGTDGDYIYGDSPGNFVYRGVTYFGGSRAVGGNGNGAAGQPPGGGGGGGQGGFYTVAWPGGKGGRGDVWIVARQS
ncbi:minor tail protein [Mycobacterium phage BirdsNest]|uniref:Minor tail protein n=1 Tax=Mycobacterium phage BirdsNest TaxID=2686231 RepID=A0A6B9LF42_9CAUD|nr:minor tail protein [Mycobacterium phage BirdsNest]QHB37335.1 minor tail protein [Mycobacterium phage BirdsNest]